VICESSRKEQSSDCVANSLVEKTIELLEASIRTVFLWQAPVGSRSAVLGLHTIAGLVAQKRC